MPAIHSMIQRYVKPTEISTSAAVVTAACYLGALISNLISPIIITKYGWAACFLYFAAIPPLVWLPLWGFIFGKKGSGIQNENENDMGGVLYDYTNVNESRTMVEFDVQTNGGDTESTLKLKLKLKSNDVSFIDTELLNESDTKSNSLTSSEKGIIATSPAVSSSQPITAPATITITSKGNTNINISKDKVKSDISVYEDIVQKAYVRDDWAVDASESDPLIKSSIQYSTESDKIFNINTNKIINENEIKSQQNENEKGLPLSFLLKSRPVWAIMAAQYGQSWGMIGLLSWLPTYYSERFHVPLDSLANFTVLPYFLQMIVGISAGLLADKLITSGVRTLTVRKSLQIIGMLVPAGCLTLCAYLPSLDASTAAAFITFGSAISAVTVAAVSANHFDISPKNAGTVFGIGNTAGCIGIVNDMKCLFIFFLW